MKEEKSRLYIFVYKRILILPTHRILNANVAVKRGLEGFGLGLSVLVQLGMALS